MKISEKFFKNFTYNNFNNWILEFYNSEKKEIEFDFGDEIISSSVLVFDGKILNERFKER